MPPRFDDPRRTLHLAVADLLDADLLRSLGFANRGGFERLWLGQAIHSGYQEQAIVANPSYQREVTVRASFEHRGWQVELSGRIDGLRRDPDGTVWVEEIKSVRAGAALATSTAEIYRQQARLYAWMLALERSQAVNAELVLIEIGGGEIERHPLEVDPAAVEASVRRRLNALLRQHEQEAETRRARHAAAERLAFPFYAPRPGQELIIERTTRALEAGEHLLIEAATGLGKTVACLFPVLRHALARDQRVFVLTAKTLQQEMSATVLDLLNRDRGWNALRLRAKAKMCANDELICHEEYCSYAKDYYLKLQQSQLVARLLADHATLDPDTIYAAARAAAVCPFEVSLELGTQSQAVVCDYNYAFDPWVSLAEFREDGALADTILVIDEIHNLVERGRGYLSPQLSAERCRAVAAEPLLPGDALGERMAALAHELARLIDDTANDALPGTRPGAGPCFIPADALWCLRPEFDRVFVEHLEHRRATKSFRAEDPFVDLYFALLRFLATLAQSDRAEFTHCAERTGSETLLRIVCLDPSRYLGSVIRRSHATIGLSATLSPPEFYRALLGFDAERTDCVRVPNPFPREHRRVVVDRSVTTTFRERPDNYLPIARRLAEFAAQVPGNCLALFPSYDFLAAVARELPDLPKRVLVQQRADGDAERAAILDTLRSALFGDVLLLAVAGGVFAEGVDYPGDMLRAVAVIGPCLPAVSFEQKLLESYYDERFERGFEYAFVVPGMTRVVQAAGRLIRSSEDTGVIALFDRRFLAEPYRSHLPAEWLEGNDAGAPFSGHPASVAAAFFAGLSRPAE